MLVFQVNVKDFLCDVHVVFLFCVIAFVFDLCLTWVLGVVLCSLRLIV